MTSDNLVPPFEEANFEKRQLIIIGAGPTGLFLALKLVQQGINVLVLEAENGIAQSPRATTYMPIVLNEFEKIGFLDDVITNGYKNSEGVIFRKAHNKGGDVLATLKLSVVPKGTLKFDYAGIHMGQHQLAALILKRAQEFPNFEVRFGHRFVGLQQKPDGVDVTVVTRTGEKFLTADYLIGADGAGSSVRRALCIPFEGFTWSDFRFMATNVKYPFEKYGFGTANMILDEENWAVIARTGTPEEGIWRVAYGVRTTVPENELVNTVKEKYEALLPGPRPLKYELLNANPYWAHQRVARTFVKDRVVLTGDAGHSNNPIGGLGLTTGLLDAAALGNVFIRIYKKGEADPKALLAKYGEVRRKAFVEYSNPQSIANKLRLHSLDPEVVKQRDAFFDGLNGGPEFHLKVASMMNEVLEENFE